MIGASSFQSVIALLRRANTWVADQIFNGITTFNGIVSFGAAITANAAIVFNGLLTATAGVILNALTFNGSAVSHLLVGRASATYTASANLTAILPNDDTVPTSTEGTQILSVSYTPKKIGNKGRINFSGHAGSSSAVTGACTLHIDGGNAVAVGVATFGAADEELLISFVHDYDFVSLTPVVFSVRAGVPVGILRLNGISTARRYGGIDKATLEIMEIAS